MKPELRAQSPAVLAAKVPKEVAEAVYRQAREDDRTVSQYLRRLITAAVQPELVERER